MLDTYLRYLPENPRKQEKEHYHHDFLYIFTISTTNPSLQITEVSDFAWVDMHTIIQTDPDSFVSKAIKRMQALHIV